MTADDVTLTEAEREAVRAGLRAPQAIAPDAEYVYAAVERILADRLASVQAQRERWGRSYAEKVMQLAAARDEIADRLSMLLCDLTGGLMSKTNYSVATMRQAIEAEFEKHATADMADTIARAESAERRLAEVGARALTDPERAALNERLHSDGFYAPAVRARILDAFDDILRAALANPPTAPCGRTDAHGTHDMPCDSGCQPDWHRDSCAIYGTCPGLANPPALAQHDAEVGAREWHEGGDGHGYVYQYIGPVHYLCECGDYFLNRERWLAHKADALTTEGGQS